MKIAVSVAALAGFLASGVGVIAAEAVKDPKTIARSSALDPFVQRGVDWLARAQHPDGGWGAGSHANQQLRDPHQVITDPATTAFVALALVRAGSTPEAGPHKDVLRRATLHLLNVVETAPETGPRITDLQGTQPQAKLGVLVDTGMTAQYLARILPTLQKGSALQRRADTALGRCVRKLEGSQLVDGNWNAGGGWAGLLQSSLSTSALEMALSAGKKVDADKLERARRYQKGHYDAATGRAEAGTAAGVELYAFTSAQRANAAEALEAVGYISAAKEKGRLPAEAVVNVDNLKKAGLDERKAKSLDDAYRAGNAALRRIGDEQLLSGFGSNGGEEYLSYLQTSESLVIAGGPEWEAWKKKMSARLMKIQSQDGSWTGHHCITSPVFCTAAVVQTLTADRDARALRQVASAKKG